jgi:hypothetical protein
MATLRDVVAYLCEQYPHKNELSKARLTKMVYLADWKSAIERGCQITDILWVFNHYGPYVDDVVDSIRDDPAFEVVRTANVYGDQKELIRLREQVKYPTLTDEDRKILDFVVERTAPKYWNDFIRLVYSTYPVMTQARHSALDLVGLAKRYDAEKQSFDWD